MININVSKTILNEVNKLNMKKNITDIDLTHVPFSKFKVTIQNITDYNIILETVKNENLKRHGRIDIFECMTQASKIMEDFKNKDHIVNFNITEKELFIYNDDYEIRIPNVKILNMVNNKVVSDIKILADDLIDEINSMPNEFEKRNFANNLCIEALSILLGIITIFNDKKDNYIYTETENKTPQVSQKKKSKNKKSKKVTYISHKTITIHKSESRSNGSYTRHTDSWPQRGHWRTYKSGKRVWIKECVKNAKNKSSKGEIDKTYEII